MWRVSPDQFTSSEHDPRERYDNHSWQQTTLKCSQTYHETLCTSKNLVACRSWTHPAIAPPSIIYLFFLNPWKILHDYFKWVRLLRRVKWNSLWCQSQGTITYSTAQLCFLWMSGVTADAGDAFIRPSKNDFAERASEAYTFTSRRLNKALVLSY